MSKAKVDRTWRGSAELTEKLVPIPSLQHDPENARRHPPRNIEAIRQSLDRYGQVLPVLMRGGVIVAGNGTVVAATELGWTHVAALSVDHLSEQEARARAIALNRAPELAEWDYAQLAESFKVLPEDLLPSTGFAEFEIGPLVRAGWETGAPKWVSYRTEMVPLESIHPHERNYRRHTPEQTAHLIESIRANGFYRNVVVARDGTILAGHGVVEACTQMGVVNIPVVRLDLDPTDSRALKILTGDNEIAQGADVDDRVLSELLKEILDTDVDGLLGTGFDADQLAALAFTSRPSSEFNDIDEAKEWVGMPGYDHAAPPIPVLVVRFESKEAREAFCAEKGIHVHSRRGGRIWSANWPPRRQDDPRSVAFTEAPAEAPAGEPQ